MIAWHKYRFETIVIVVAAGLLLVAPFRSKISVTEETSTISMPTTAPTAIPLSLLRTLRPAPGSTSYSIDALTQDENVNLLTGATTLSLVKTKPLYVVGWAVDREGHKPATALMVTIDGTAISECSPFFTRADVAKELRDARFSLSGFDCEVPPSRLPAGTHHMGLAIVTASHSLYSESLNQTVEVR